MTDAAHEAYAADDSILLYLVRDGDTEAFEVLRHRHEHAARRLACCLVPAEQVGDVVAEAFDRVLRATLRGGGPADAFRPYVLTALRRVSYDRLHMQRTGVPAGPGQLDDPGEPLMDPAVASLESSLIVRAFRSLPERWIAVLWHTEIEDTDPAELGQILGLPPGEAATLQRRAWDGLRRAYLRMQIADGTWPECQPVVRRLAAYIEDAASGRDSAMVTEHLRQCDDCRAVWAQLRGLDVVLRTMVAPVFLGSATAAYLSGEAVAASAVEASAVAASAVAASAAPATSASGQLEAAEAAEAAHPEMAGEAGETANAPAAAAVRARHHRAPALSGRGSRRLRWAAATAVPVAAIVAALALTLAGGGTPPGPPQRHQQALAATGAATPAGSGSPQKTAAHPAPTRTGNSPAAVSASPASAGTSSPSPSHSGSPGTASVRPPGAAKLSAAVSIGARRDGNTQVTWTVTNTGSAATGELTVSLSFPPGAQAFQAESESWTCQATAAGASCQHGALTAGSQAQGSVLVAIDGQQACGLPVHMTASSGGASASAESSGVISCRQSR